MSQESKLKEVLVSDRDFIVKSYRELVEILEAVRVGLSPREDLDTSLDSFIRFKLPEKYQSSIIIRKDLEGKYREPHLGEIASLKMKYQSQEERDKENTRIENDIKWNCALDQLEQIKRLLETELIMNNFVSTSSEKVSTPV